VLKSKLQAPNKSKSPSIVRGGEWEPAPSPSPPFKTFRGQGFTLAILVFSAVILLLFHRSFLPTYALFSNDGPLGRLESECHRLPGRFLGSWQDLSSVGYKEGNALPDLTYGLMFLLGPVVFSKVYAPAALLLLGLGAWVFFRQIGLAPLACLLGGLAAMLNSTFFSAACWGVASHAITVAMGFLALAALAVKRSPQSWLPAVTAGVAVGMGVLEGADIGAIFSLLIAGFVIYQSWTAEG